MNHLMELVNFLESVEYYILAYPSGKLAFIFFNGVELKSSLEISMDLGHFLIRITPECSGRTFTFLLLWLTLSWHLKLGKKKSNLWISACFAYFLFLVGNGVRIILSYYNHLLADQWLTPNFQGIIHYSTGLVVFIPILLCVHLFGRYVYERQN